MAGEPVSAAVLALRCELQQGMRHLASIDLVERTVEVLAGRDSLWAIVRRAGADEGGIALRIAHCWGGCTKVKRKRRPRGALLVLSVDSAIGTQKIVLRSDRLDLLTLRVTVTLTPTAPLLIPFLPRDLYPLGPGDDPLQATGRVEAAQRGLNAGVIYFHLDEPDFGSVLYFQNLTAMNDYFVATDTKPDGAVGGEWPELGYLPPTPPQSGTPPTKPLPAGRAVTASDAILVFHDDAEQDEQNSALRFLQLLGVAYRQIDCPGTKYRDWVWRADKTLKDLADDPGATIKHYGKTYARPYLAAEYPDVMVQSSLVVAMHNYETWRDQPIELADKLARGLSKFHDAELGTMRRYLPNVGHDKDKDAVDSWYLYHPLLNIGHLALDGDKRARRFFLKSIDFGVRAARHFKYAWPIQFKVDSFKVIVGARNDDGMGQTDVGGLYAYVMLQAYELTGDQTYLHEARKAIDAARGMRFELNYQSNLTAWGAAACMRLWRVTNEQYYRHQSYVYLASFFHNTVIWESEIGHAKHYNVFLGVTALHDAPYMAAFEAFDSFAAFERYLRDSGPDLDPAARLLVSEYCKYAIDRTWSYYPDALPADAVAQHDIRNGHIDRKRSFPLEDLYVDGQDAGQVGQEVYGAGAAFVFASRVFHNVSDAPFRIFCDHFPVTSQRTSARSLTFGLDGGRARDAIFSLTRTGDAPIPKVRLVGADGTNIRSFSSEESRIDFKIPASGQVSLRW